jgi:DNA-binding transcriptional LysR family regulator
MNPPPLAHLQAFATVARLRSFRAAAQALGVSPSALSHTLRELENRLGVRLLNRTTRSVAPSEAGAQLLARLAPALQDIDGALDALNDFRSTPLGTLRINAPRAAAEWVVAPLLAGFLAANPGMHCELVANDALVDIVSEGFDAGVRFGESLQQDMVAVPIGPPQRMIVVAAPDYLARHGTPQSPRDLPQHECIRLRFPSGVLYRWEFARRTPAGEEKLEVAVDGRLTLGEMPLLVRAAVDGVGLAFVFEQYARAELAAGRLVSVLDEWCPSIPGLFLYYPSRRHLPAGLRAFVEMLRGAPGSTAGLAEQPG